MNSRENTLFPLTAAIALLSLQATAVIADTKAAAGASTDSSLSPNNRPTPYDEEVVVTSSRIEMPLREVATSVTVLDTEDLSLKGYNNLFDALRTQGSIGVTNTGGAGQTTSLRIRGEEGYRTLVLIDGVDMSDPSGPQVSSRIENLLSSQDIERVEILRGPQGFMYGADAGGVVNIITRNGQDGFSASLQGEAGSMDTQRFGGQIAGGNETVDGTLSISDFSTEGFNTRRDDEDFADNDGANNTTVHVKAGWNISSELRAVLVYRDITADAEYDNCRGLLDHDCRSEIEQNNLKASLAYNDERISHLLSYATTEVDRSNITDASLVTATRSLAEGQNDELEYVGSIQINEASTAVVGADYERSEMATQSTFSRYNGKRNQLGLFAEYQLDVTDNWFVTAGLRHDDNEDFGRNNSWRVSSAYLQSVGDSAEIKYRASYGTGFRAPSLYEIAYNASSDAFGDAANFVPNKETSEGYEVGVDYLRDNGTLLQLTYFNQTIQDQIFFDRVGSSGYLQASGESRSSGVEMAVDIPLNHGLNLVSNYTYNDTEQADGDSRIRRPRHLGNLGISWSLLERKLQLLANLRVSSGSVDTIFGVDASVKLDSYDVFDFSANYALNKNLTFTARIENLFGENYQEALNYNTADRAAYVGVRYQF